MTKRTRQAVRRADIYTRFSPACEAAAKAEGWSAVRHRHSNGIFVTVDRHLYTIEMLTARSCRVAQEDRDRATVLIHSQGVHADDDVEVLVAGLVEILRAFATKQAAIDLGEVLS